MKDVRNTNDQEDAEDEGLIRAPGDARQCSKAPERPALRWWRWSDLKAFSQPIRSEAVAVRAESSASDPRWPDDFM